MRTNAIHSVWFLVFSEFQLLDVCGPLQVFATANDELRLRGDAPLYETRVLAHEIGLVRSSSGAYLQAAALPKRLTRGPDTAVVPGGPGAWSASGQHGNADAARLVDWTRRAAPRIARLASVCTGAFVLARAGVLDGRRAVTHWAACESLQAQFPAVSVERDAIYFRDGTHWTSAGVTAGIDMALAMVEQDAGADIAMAVAKRLVVFYRRPGGQSQFSSALLAQSVSDERIAQLHEWVLKHLNAPLDVPQLAERLAMTPRTFARFYRQRTGTTPARAIEQMRLERACALIESRRTSIKAVAQQCGFPSEEVMRRSFLRRLHVTPSEYRARFSSSDKQST